MSDWRKRERIARMPHFYVDAVNDPPVITLPFDTIISDEDESLQIVGVTVYDVDLIETC